jgi:hypothetical protein
VAGRRGGAGRVARHLRPGDAGAPGAHIWQPTGAHLAANRRLSGTCLASDSQPALVWHPADARPPRQRLNGGAWSPWVGEYGDPFQFDWCHETEARTAWYTPYTSEECRSEQQTRARTLHGLGDVGDVAFADWAGEEAFVYGSCTEQQTRRRYGPNLTAVTGLAVTGAVKLVNCYR